ncbi:hypothetical protein Ddye_030421 [Dipteronia dyeriana]|uniref:Uncharacterized protein n=1 Tax=Dipteronia dyeriana TaxID=168575 RepID=A0AAD9THD6_9ROSI|nr:hypothetical protein Ddye_030421 [Dipteronia dyeriana]
MGFSCGDDHFNKKEKEVVVVDESSRERGMHNHGVELEVEFWPVEHPLEPQDEDRPVKCPISAPSSVINESRMQEECSGKRAEVVAYTEVNKEGIVMALEPPVRAVRKRHHTLTQDDREDHTTTTTIKPLMRMPPIPPPLPTHNNNNITIFQMLQHFDNFES